MSRRPSARYNAVVMSGTSRKKVRSWRWAIALSIFVHFALAVTAVIFVLEPDASAPAPGPADPAEGFVSGRREQPGRPAATRPDEPTIEDAADLLAAEQERVAALSDAEKLDELDERADALERMSPAKVDSLAGIVERAAGADRSRAYRPDPDATGPFDHDSAVTYDIRTLERDGETVYEYTFVDKEGRTLVGELPASAVPDSERTSARVFEMARRRPTLRRLIDAALAIGSARVRRERESAPPATQPEP